MKNYTYHKEVETLLTQFVTALDGAIVKRLNSDDEECTTIQVKYVYAPKGRIIQDLINKEQNITLPIVSIQLNSMSRAGDRQVNKHTGPLECGTTTPIETLQPVPIDLNVTVSGICKYQRDLDQIVSNFVPYFDPYIIISSCIPDTTVRMNNKIEWGGSINYTYPSEIAPTSQYRVGFDTTFKIEGWIYKEFDDSGVTIILSEELGGGTSLNFYTTETRIYNETIELSTLTGDVNYTLQNSQNLIWIDPDDTEYTTINPQYSLTSDGTVEMTCVTFNDPDLLFNINDMGANYVGDLSDFSDFYGHAIFTDATAMTGDISDVVNPYRLDLTNCTNITGVVSEESTVMKWYLNGTSLDRSDIGESISNIKTYVETDPYNLRYGVFDWSLGDTITDSDVISDILYLTQLGWDIDVNYSTESYNVEYVDGGLIVHSPDGGRIVYKL